MNEGSCGPSGMRQTELRDFGDGNTVVLYTEDHDVYRKMSTWESCSEVVPYEQGGRVIAYDLYFPIEMARQVKSSLGL